MNADSTIEALALDFGPVRSARIDPLLIAGAAILPAVAVVLFWGLRPGALQTAALWMKCGYSVPMAGGALWLAFRLGKPGVDCRPALAVMLLPIAAAAVAAAFVVAAVPASQWTHDLFGRTWTTCSLSIALLSALTAPMVVLAARSLAPVRPHFAGAALGVGAGALAATAYGVLHCTESSPLFVAVWYTLGIIAAGAMGAFWSHMWLKW